MISASIRRLYLLGSTPLLDLPDPASITYRHATSTRKRKRSFRSRTKRPRRSYYRIRRKEGKNKPEAHLLRSHLLMTTFISQALRFYCRCPWGGQRWRSLVGARHGRRRAPYPLPPRMPTSGADYGAAPRSLCQAAQSLSLITRWQFRLEYCTETGPGSNTRNCPNQICMFDLI